MKIMEMMKRYRVEFIDRYGVYGSYFIFSTPDNIQNEKLVLIGNDCSSIRTREVR